MNEGLERKFVIVHWHAILFVMPVCALMINRRSRTGLLRLTFRIQSWAYHCIRTGLNRYKFPVWLVEDGLKSARVYFVWRLLRGDLMAGANKKNVISKSVSQLFGKTAENNDVIPFSDDQQFNISGRIPAYALMERRTSKHAVSGTDYVRSPELVAQLVKALAGNPE